MMRWSWSVGTIKGTIVRIHWTFLLFLAWIVIASYAAAGTPAAVGAGLFIVLLFLCVLLHEFGHILTARRFGVRTPDVTLYPIGGIARMETIPERPRQELLIALAGPAVNLVIALLLVLAIGGLSTHEAMDLKGLGQNIVPHLALANLALALFNLIPAFPMDGGRALRALLATRLGYARGTRVAAGIGQALALGLGLLALLGGNVILAIIAAFVFFAAGAEAGMAQLKGDTLGALAADVMMTDFEVLTESNPVAAAADHLIRTSQRDFLVLDAQGQLAGVLTRDGIIKALREGAANSPIGQIMKKEVPAVSVRHHADALLPLLNAGAPIVAVVDEAGRLVGIVTLENLLEHVLILNARRGVKANLPFSPASA